MSAGGIVALAEGVAAYLRRHGAVTLSYAPDYTPSEIGDRRIVVVPAAVRATLSSRKAVQEDLVVSVGVLKKVSAPAEVPGLVELVCEIGRELLGGVVCSRLCVDASWDPMLSMDDLRSRGQFVGVVNCTYRRLD